MADERGRSLLKGYSVFLGFSKVADLDEGLPEQHSITVHIQHSSFPSQHASWPHDMAERICQFGQIAFFARTSI